MGKESLLHFLDNKIFQSGREKGVMVEKLLGQKVNITTVVATFRNIRCAVTNVGDGLLEIKDQKGRIIYIHITQCGTIRIEGEQKVNI